MFWSAICEEPDRNVIKAKNFEKKIISFHLISDSGSNTIGVNYFDGIPLGIFDPIIRKKAFV